MRQILISAWLRFTCFLGTKGDCFAWCLLPKDFCALRSYSCLDPLHTLWPSLFTSLLWRYTCTGCFVFSNLLDARNVSSLIESIVFAIADGWHFAGDSSIELDTVFPPVSCRTNTRKKGPKIFPCENSVALQSFCSVMHQ